MARTAWQSPVTTYSLSALGGTIRAITLRTNVLSIFPGVASTRWL